MILRACLCLCLASLRQITNPQLWAEVFLMPALAGLPEVDLAIGTLAVDAMVQQLLLKFRPDLCAEVGLLEAFFVRDPSLPQQDDVLLRLLGFIAPVVPPRLERLGLAPCIWIDLDHSISSATMSPPGSARVPSAADPD